MIAATKSANVWRLWDCLDLWNGREWNAVQCGAILSCMDCIDGWMDGWMDVWCCDVSHTNSRIRSWALFENAFLPQNQPSFCPAVAWSPNPWRHSSPTLWIVFEFPGCREAQSPPTRKALPPLLLNHSELSSHYCHTNELCAFLSQFFAAWRDAAWVNQEFILPYLDSGDASEGVLSEVGIFQRPLELPRPQAAQ